MTSMYGPNRSPYGGYGNYWGGYGRAPHPPPPPPLPPQEPPSFHPPPPPPPHFRPIRPPPNALRPPPPPPPVRLPRPQQQQTYPNQPPQGRQQTQNSQERKTQSSTSYRPQTTEQQSNQQNLRSRHSNGGIPSRRPSEYEDEPERLESDSSTIKPLEPIVGSPLVPRRKEKEPPPITKPSIPNNKRPLPVEFDPNLPEELVAKFHNNSCELCDVKLNSRIQAKNHYEGKQHRKKVKNYIIEHARKDGQSPAKMAKIDLSTPKKKVEPLDVSQLYCKCCDLSFTSEQHAQQHYMGRNHQRVLHGLKPLKAGYYNKETGKWQRMPPDPRVSVERVGLNLEPPSEEGSDQISEKSLDPDAVKERGRFFCELCNVSATSQDQLDGHMTGQRHLKALRLNAKKTTTASTDDVNADMAVIVGHKILDGMLGQSVSIDPQLLFQRLVTAGANTDKLDSSDPT
ncbi:zinc finger matrin-type protein 3-like isoform X2 [Homarus americanus]|uniref:Zinc finger matrin-type protein 3-like 2 n=1 Tax=Homarus americanus TaxID=6706 RepID=A0A8J5JZR2_HOMAM|nr:zinc finger matrin-type protein 3-like isoform X2 [Homarus americanus]KAG7167477.1 Zinc finger matrin-type protein 3-like 2 [Homarus americanus]